MSLKFLRNRSMLSWTVLSAVFVLFMKCDLGAVLVLSNKSQEEINIKSYRFIGFYRVLTFIFCVRACLSSSTAGHHQ